MSPRWIFVTLTLLGALTAAGYFALGNNAEYNPPTSEQLADAETALELVPAFEHLAEQDYFNANLHAGLSLAYAYALLAHTDNSTYFEQMISEFAVSLKIDENPEVLSQFRQLYDGYHTNRTPKNIYTPTQLSFEKWRELVNNLTPFPEDVRIVVDAERDLDTAWQQFQATHPTIDPNMLMSYQAATGRIQAMFQIATGRRILSPPGGGRLFLTHVTYRRWGAAVHAYGYATRNDFSASEIFDHALPADAVRITGGEDRGCFRIAPDLTIVPGVRFFQAAADH